MGTSYHCDQKESEQPGQKVSQIQKQQKERTKKRTLIGIKRT
jgi:hypothetical protein